MAVIPHLALTRFDRLPPHSLLALFPVENEEAEAGFDLAVYFWVDELEYDPERLARAVTELEIEDSVTSIETLDAAIHLLRWLGWWEKATDLDREILEGLLVDSVRPDAIEEHWQANRAWYAAVAEEGEAA